MNLLDILEKGTEFGRKYRILTGEDLQTLVDDTSCLLKSYFSSYFNIITNFIYSEI